jgi:macrolide transport system ATP-binding/permease protein
LAFLRSELSDAGFSCAPSNHTIGKGRIFISREIVLTAANIKKTYGTKTVLDFASFKVYEGEKIGVVGLNGAGKTTLLGVLCGDITPDGGFVSLAKEAGYIRQFGENEARLSGGGNTKRRIQEETGKRDSIIFADEPTSNLDSDGISWVRAKLLAAKTVLLISHDRALLDDICDRIVEVKNGRLNFYTGNYTDYLRQVEEEEQRRAINHGRYLRESERLKQAIGLKERKAAKQKRQRKTDLAKNPSEARLGGHKRAASVKQQERGAAVLKKRLERLEDTPPEGDPPKFRINFDLTDPPRNRLAVYCPELCFSYGEREVFSHAVLEVPCGRKIAVTGKNGAGKTTLLNLIHSRDTRLTLAPKLKTGYMRQCFENISNTATVLENAMADAVQERSSVCSILAGLKFYGDDFTKKAGVLSGGERIRLSLAMLIASGCNALLLDEPTNYLDTLSVEAVEAAVKSYPGTVIFVSHDARFVANAAEAVLQIADGKIVVLDMI